MTLQTVNQSQKRGERGWEILAQADSKRRNQEVGSAGAGGSVRHTPSLSPPRKVEKGGRQRAQDPTPKLGKHSWAD